MLRWGLEKGYVILPKSTNPGRLKQNKELFDFELSKEDMEKLDALQKTGFRRCWNPFGVRWGDVSKWNWE